MSSSESFRVLTSSSAERSSQVTAAVRPTGKGALGPGQGETNCVYSVPMLRMFESKDATKPAPGWP